MGEGTIKVAFLSVVRVVLLWGGVSFLVSVLLWKLVPLSLPIRFGSVIVSSLLLLFLVQLRFLSQMTVGLWTRLWGSAAPLLLGSVVTLTFVVVCRNTFRRSDHNFSRHISI